MATAKTMNHSSQAAGESSKNMDMTGLASLLPMPISTKQSAGRKCLAETVSETLSHNLPQIVINLKQCWFTIPLPFLTDFGDGRFRAWGIASGALAEIVAAMFVLERDQERLERAHERQNQNHGERQPRSRCSHTGGAYLTSVMSAEATTIPPTIRMMNATGPSPLSWGDRSTPQAGHRGRTVKNP
jgi:hypothetical protein